MKQCIVCGKEFEPHNKRQICCSAPCKKKRHRENTRNWKRKNYPSPLSHRNCVICGKEFKAKTANHQTCSPECSYELKKQKNRKVEITKKRDRVCIVCGKPVTNGHYLSKYCSKECYYEAQKKRQGDYNKAHARNKIASYSLDIDWNTINPGIHGVGPGSPEYCPFY